MDTRISAARRRAAVAKLALGGTGALVFVLSAALARAAYPGHHKKAIASLSPPAGFVRVVRENQLESGILAPTQADPSAATATS
ncbi:MAG: hypothetical protein QOG06_2416 [Gaiellaceae bacterium]|jgi:hypothetical protein|nr:hypothetical protein [Gaiellaceae bacterium]